MERARQWRTAAVACLLAGALAACGDGGTVTGSSETSPTTPTMPPATTATATTAPPSPAATASPSASPALDDGRHPAYVTDVNLAAGTITVDVVQFFTGAAASSAAAEDGSSEVPPPNDYWIRNVNRRLRTLPVAAGAPITVNVLAAEETGSATRDVRVSLDQLAGYGDLSGHLFWVSARDARVVGLAEQFLP